MKENQTDQELLNEDQLLQQQILLDKDKKITELTQQIKDIELRSLKVYEENTKLKSNPEVAKRQSVMDYQMQMAQKFFKAGVYKVKSAEEAFIIIKAGEELELTEIQSMNTFYIVGGMVKPFGARMIGLVQRLGYKVEYLEETEDQVKVRVSKGDECYEEIARKDDPILKESKALKFAPKNKLRFHGVRLICDFHLADKFMSIGDSFTEEFREWEDVNYRDENLNTKVSIDKELEDGILGCKDLDSLEKYYKENKREITKNIKLISLYNGKKDKFKDGK